MKFIILFHLKSRDDCTSFHNMMVRAIFVLPARDHQEHLPPMTHSHVAAEEEDATGDGKTSFK